MSLTAAPEKRGERFRLGAPFAPVITISDEGLVLGATVLAPMRRDACGTPALAIGGGAEERILALLSAGYGKAVGGRVLDNIRRASKYWSQGETHLASIELALTGLPYLDDAKYASFRLFLADKLLADGFSPRELMRLSGIDRAPLDVIKGGYNPDQPRVPAGNPDGGQWTSDGGETPPTTAAGVEFADYKVIEEPPRDAKIVITPDGVPISGGDPPILLIAPPRADFREVYPAGQAIASLALSEQYSLARAAIAQGETYDFQWDVPEQ